MGAIALLSFAPVARGQQPGVQVSGTISAPKPGAIETPAPPNVTHVLGHFQASGGIQHKIIAITVGLVWKGPGSPPVPGPFSFCNDDANKPCAPGDGVDFDQPLSPMPAFNGPYTVTATAQARDPITGQTVPGGTPPFDFGVAVKPGKPGNPKTAVTVKPDKTREVTVTWDRNGEADLQFYDVYRQGPGDKYAQLIGRVLQPDSGTRAGMIDDKVPPAAGSYTYNIYAVRPGATGDVKTSAAISDDSLVKATVPAGNANATTTPTQPPPKGTPAGPPILKSTTGSIPKLSSGTATTPTSEAVTPDPGFVRGLPYGGTNTTLPGEGEGGDASVAQTPGGGRHTSNQKGVLAPVATGAILFVGAFQLRWLKRRLDEEPTMVKW